LGRRVSFAYLAGLKFRILNTLKGKGRVWWCSLVIPGTPEVEVERSWFKASPGKGIGRPYLKSKLKGLKVRLKWCITYLKTLSSI
jgi:hypothetical protein